MDLGRFCEQLLLSRFAKPEHVVKEQVSEIAGNWFVAPIDGERGAVLFGGKVPQSIGLLA